jgi:hypothetical protein
MSATDRTDADAAVAVTDEDVAAFREDGFVVLRGAFDPAPLAAEFDAALARGFARLGPVNTSAQAAIRFRYLPMMSELTPVSVGLLRRFRPAAERLLGGPVLPVRTKAVEYHGGSDPHRDHELPVASVGFACYLEPLEAATGSLRVVPGSHRGGAAGEERAVSTRPGDVIAFEEHLVHASRGGTLRRQWRVDYLARPDGPEAEATASRYLADIFSPDWDAGYDVDAFPTYGPHWRAVADPADDALLARLGAYTAAREEEDAARTRRGG